MGFLTGLAVLLAFYIASFKKGFWSWKANAKIFKETNKPLVIGGLAFAALAYYLLFFLVLCALMIIPQIREPMMDLATTMTSGRCLVGLVIVVFIGMFGIGIGTALPNPITVDPTEREKEEWNDNFFNGHSPHIDSGMTFEQWRRVQASYAEWAFFETVSGRTSLPFPEWYKEQRKDIFFRLEEKRNEWEYRCRREELWCSTHNKPNNYF